MPKHRGLQTVAVLALSSLLGACCHSTGGSPVGEPRIETIDLVSLPAEAWFAPIGSIGTAYRVTGGYPGEARLPTGDGAADGLLPATIRLFRFDERAGRWSEIPESRYDGQSRELVALNLGSGVYTAFGWSANPAENAFQRLLLDASLGYGGFFDPLASREALDRGQDASVRAFRRDALLSWFDFSFNYPKTTCGAIKGEDERDCPPACDLAAAHEVLLLSCQVETVMDGREVLVDCPQPRCCECVTGTVTERAVIPGSFFERLPPPCARGPRSFPCPICPDGLSCPGGGFTGLPAIAPVLEIPDYTFLETFGLGAVRADPVFSETLEEIMKGVTGIL